MEQTDLDKLLDAPAFGADGLLNDSGPSLGDQVDASELDQATAPSPAENDDEDRVPVSRFRKTREELISAREQLASFNTLQQELAEIKNELRSSRSQSATSATKDAWVKLYGDSSESIEAYDLQQSYLASVRDDLKNEMREESLKEQQYRTDTQEAVSNQFDDQRELLEESLGKALKDDDAASLLEIVEEFSPQNDDGTYNPESLMSLEKAYDIFQMRRNAPRGNRASKDELSRIASASSEGSTQTTSSERPDWNDWTKRFGG
jgi:hypothetical protein